MFVYRNLAIKGRICIEICICSFMKRHNPSTQQPFKRGDVREDGFVFFNYTARLKSDGFFMERWLSPDASQKAKVKDKATKKAKYQKKTNRHLPGFDGLSAQQKATANILQKLGTEWNQYGDMTLEMVAEDLMGYEVDAGPLLEEAIRHAGSLPFDAKEAFKLSLSI
jgi:hypothetical protein